VRTGATPPRRGSRSTPSTRIPTPSRSAKPAPPPGRGDTDSRSWGCYRSRGTRTMRCNSRTRPTRWWSKTDCRRGPDHHGVFPEHGRFAHRGWTRDSGGSIWRSFRTEYPGAVIGLWRGAVVRIATISDLGGVRASMRQVESVVHLFTVTAPAGMVRDETGVPLVLAWTARPHTKGTSASCSIPGSLRRTWGKVCHRTRA
jgi:hypothetical protein